MSTQALEQTHCFVEGARMKFGLLVGCDWDEHWRKGNPDSDYIYLVDALNRAQRLLTYSPDIVWWRLYKGYGNNFTELVLWGGVRADHPIVEGEPEEWPIELRVPMKNDEDDRSEPIEDKATAAQPATEGAGEPNPVSST